jgi:hypothetical protein
MEVSHLGPPFGQVAADLLAQQLTPAVGGAVRVQEIALPTSPRVARPGAGAEAAWLVEAASLLEQVGRTPQVVGCVEGPIEGRGRSAEATNEIVAALRSTSAGLQGRLTLDNGVTWSIRVAAGTCEDTATQAGPAPAAGP